MSDGLGQTLADAANKTARSAVFTLVGHGAAALAVPFIIWIALSVSEMKTAMALVAERQLAALDRITRNERTLERIDGEDVTQADLAFRMANIDFRLTVAERGVDENRKGLSDVNSRIRMAPQ